MSPIYRSLLLAGLLLRGLSSSAQIVLGNFSPNTQDFNTLTTGSAAFTNNTTLTGLYLGSNVFFAQCNCFTNYDPNTLTANDGSTTAAQFYSLGSNGSSDRAIGGLATGQNGTGYAALRYKNSTGAVIKNLEVTYTMEQWYNSGTIDQAKFDVSYRTATTVTSVYTGTWTSVPQLTVYAPSTTKPITNQNGNLASNRVTVSFTIQNVNLAANAELMLRWQYTLNNSTNGNGLGIDDVTVTPESTIFYSGTNGNLNNVNSWGANQDGSGSRPADFTSPNQIFYVRNADFSNRLGSGWTVSGTNSKIVIGQTGAPTKLAVANNASLSGTVDVSPGSTLRIENATSTGLALGTLNTGSTVEYLSTTESHTVQPRQYSRLRLISSGPKVLGGAISVTDTLDFRDGADLTLGAYNATLASTGVLNGTSATSFFITNGAGKLRMPVAGTNAQGVSPTVVFPVGTSASSYTPAIIKQNTSQSQDIFEVRVIDNAYRHYDANENPVGQPVVGSVVQKTWLISKETPTLPNVDVQVGLEWNAAEATPDFVPAQAFVDHYTGGRWEQVANRAAATQPRTGAYRTQRGGFASFSPFGVSSNASGVLPVELLSFGAQRTGTVVACTWATAQEKNNARFEVERSLDGRTFTTIGTVAGAGTSTSRHDYRFEDAQPLAQLSYYRLRQIDQDGSSTLSKPVAVAATEGAALSVVPNPGPGRFELLTTAPAGTELQVRVLTVLGTEVLRRQLPAGRAELDLQALPAGVYLVRVASAQGQQTVRVLKQ